MKIETTKQPNGEWTAIDADNYDVESDSIGSWSTSPQGHGYSEIEAIRDLLDQIAGMYANA